MSVLRPRRSIPEFRINPRFLVAIGALVLVLSGCGQDGESPTGPVGTGEPTTAVAAAALTLAAEQRYAPHLWSDDREPGLLLGMELFGSARGGDDRLCPAGSDRGCGHPPVPPDQRRLGSHLRRHHRRPGVLLGLRVARPARRWCPGQSIHSGAGDGRARVPASRRRRPSHLRSYDCAQGVLLGDQRIRAAR